ncbi:MAG: hypothetical protein GY722_14985 [bacterium]|nr:hypothetical protein [bacterium]
MSNLRAVPPSTRSARVRLIGADRDGFDLDAYFDQLALRSLGVPILTAAPRTFIEGASATVTVDILADVLDESDETFFLDLDTASRLVLLATRVEAVIADDDGPVAIEVDDSGAAESDTEAVLALRLLTGLDADITFHSPQDLDVVTEPIDVVATIDSEHEITGWMLSTRSAEGGEAVVLAAGSGTVTAETLAQFDPTLLLNGLHDLVLTARDTLGQTASAKVSVAVEGQMKVGHFTLSYVDLAVPVSGLDVEIVRTYDSRDREPRDFGVGWSLDIRQGSYVNNRAPGDSWQLQKGFLPCDTVVETKSHLTVVRLSEQEVYRFALRFRNGVACDSISANDRTAPGRCRPPRCSMRPAAIG